MYFIARIDAFRRVAYKEVRPADHTGSLFQLMDAEFFCHAGIYCRFIYYNCATPKIHSHSAAGLLYKRQIRCMIFFNRRRHGNNNKRCLPQFCCIRRKFHCCMLQCLASYFFRHINTRLKHRYFFRANVIANDAYLFSQRNSQRQSDIPQPYDGSTAFFLYQ